VAYSLSTRVFFTTDIHGSERCFLKFINAGKHYSAKVLIVGGDLTGKMIVPIVEKDGCYEAEYMGSPVQLSSKPQLDDLVKNLAAMGTYSYLTNQAEYEEFSKDKSKLEPLFGRLVAERMQKWITIAEERLKGTGISCFMNPGNDDAHVVDSVINGSSIVVMPEGKVISIDSKHEMVSTGYANITPWGCPRDVPEEELERRIEEMVSSVTNMRNCIFNFHCPPAETSIDLAPRLDENLTPILAPGGGFEMIHVGSLAVRRAIEKHQPMLGLHGHIHESRGFVNIGSTLCLNPGSEYLEGVLRGVLIDLNDHVKSYLLTEG
jgi:Icc-related predicted phosphoesterase